MSLNIDELVSKLLEAKKKKSSSSTGSAKKPDNSNLEQAEKEFAEYVTKINKAVEDLYMSPSERDSDIARRRAAITRKYNLPADTKFVADELPSTTQTGVKKTSGGSVDDTEAEYDDEAPLYSVDDEGEVTDDSTVASNDTGETEDEPEVVKKPKQRRRQRNQSDTSEENPVEDARKKYAELKQSLDKQVASGEITTSQARNQLLDYRSSLLRKRNLPGDTDIESPVDTPAAPNDTTTGSSAEAPTDAKPADAEFDQEEKNRLQTLAGIKSDEVPPQEPETTNAPASAANTEEPQPPQVTTMADKSTTRAGRRAPAAKKAAAKKPAAKKAAKKRGTGKPRGTPPGSGTVVGAPPPAPPAGQPATGAPRTAADINLPTNAGSEKDVTPGAKDTSASGNTNTFSGKPSAPSGGFSAGTTSTGVTGGGTAVKFTPKAAATSGTELSADEKERLAKAGFRGKELGTSAPPPAPVAAPEKPVQPWSKQGQEMRAQQMAAQAADKATRMAAMSPDERKAEEEKEKATAQRDKDASMRRLGFRPEPRGVGDRLRSAWKAFTAKPGDTVGIDKGYRSVFAEVQRLMEQLNMVEHILATESIQEGLVGGQTKLDMNKDGKLTAADFAMLRKLRKEIRSALVEQMIREELHNHNTTLAELNINQRAALMETVNGRSKKMWEALDKMRTHEPMQEDNKAAKDAYIMRLGRAVGRDGEDQFDSQAKRSGRRERIFASPDPLADREPGHMQRAVKAGEYDDVLGRTSLGRELPLGSTPKERYRNPWVDVGTYMRRSAMTDRPQLPESYTLEEWMGMLEEAGYDVSEYSLWRPKESGAKSTGVMKDPKKPKTPPAERDARNDSSSEFSKGLAAWLRAKQNKKLNELSPETLASYRAKAVAQKSNIKDKYHGTTSPTTGQTYSRNMIGLPPEATAAGDQRKFQKRTAGIAQANKNIGQQAGKAAASGDNSVFSKLDYRDDELNANAQWQIDRARKTALSQPKGQPKMAAEGTLDELSPEFKANYATAAADRANKIAAAANAGTMDKSTAHKKLDKTAKALRTADNATINKYGADKQNATIQQARTQVRDAGQTIREEKETINENTVSRLQQLAGINPTE